MLQSAAITITVFDILGRTVVTLVDGVVSAGDHFVRWDASGLQSGMYFCRLQSPVGLETRKRLLVR